MRHVAAYLLAVMGSGSAQPSNATIKAILGSVGVEADDKQLTVLLDKLAGKNVNQLIEQGLALVSTMPCGGGGGGGGGGAPAGGAADAAPAAAEKKEEKKEEPEEESDDDMGFGLFD